MICHRCGRRVPGRFEDYYGGMPLCGKCLDEVEEEEAEDS